MKFLLPLAIIVSLLLVYVLWGRDWLKSTVVGAGFLAWIEPFEIALYKKSVTILFGRLLTGLGALLTLLTQIGSIDITPVMPFVPEKHQGLVQVAWNMLPLLISGLGLIVEKLRNNTTLPIEVVAVPDKVLAENANVAKAVDAAVIAKTEAVAVVKEEKAA